MSADAGSGVGIVGRGEHVADEGQGRAPKDGVRAHAAAALLLLLGLGRRRRGQVGEVLGGRSALALGRAAPLPRGKKYDPVREAVVKEEGHVRRVLAQALEQVKAVELHERVGSLKH